MLLRPTAERSNDLPLVVWAVPLVVVLGLIYGLSRGGALNLAYHEARGILFAFAAFAVTPGTDARYRRLAFHLFLGSTAFLAATILLRYLAYVRYGSLPVAQESAFAHDSVIYLALSIGLCTFLVLRGASGRDRWVLLGLTLISLVAILATGRRSGTLVLVIGLGAILFLTAKHRPILTAYAAIAIAVVGTLYVAAYWNKEYGALAQPARAIRSQINPSERDDSSDLYREFERANLEETIRYNRLFGIGFGRPFGHYVPLPDLTSYWPLQSYTPHQNIMWLWLKMGILGIAIILATFAIAIRRCLSVLRSSGPNSDTWQIAAIVFVGLLMYLTFATVDVIFPATRGMVILGVLMSLALSMNIKDGNPEGSN
jgi:O-antigen ligase